MSYEAQELSTDSGQPLELFVFQQGLQSWRYTSSEQAVVILGVPYESSPIIRSGVSQLNDISGVTMSLTFPRDHEFAAMFLGFSPELVTTVTVFRVHATDNANELNVYWKGRVITGKASNNELTLECESVFTSMRRVGLRARYQLNCRHALYSFSCGVAKEAHKVSGVINTISGITLTSLAAATQPSGWFTGGMVILPSGGARFITAHTGTQLTLSRPFVEYVMGSNIDIYPGCDHLRTTCSSKFSNVLNFGGFPYIPSTNPFSGKSIV